MTLQQVRYVLEISRYGSISKAAQELYLTQPYLSNILKDLENELQITIFARTRKGVMLTEEGKEFLQYAKPLLDQEARILKLYENHTTKPTFRFAVSTQRYPFVIKAFQRFYETLSLEQFQIHLRESSMDYVIRDVSENRSDLGIIFLSATTESFIRKYISVRGLEFHEIVAIRPRIFFRKTHPLAKLREISLEELQSYPFASFESSNTSIDFSEETLLLDAAVENRRIYIIDRGTMINILTHTDAFSIGTGILSAGFAGPELTSRPIKGHGKEIKIGWLHNTAYPVSGTALQFVKTLEKVIQQDNIE